MAITFENTSRTATINEGELQDFPIHYHVAGEGPVVVLLHGGGPGASGWSNFERNIQAFVDAGFQVVLPDCPGYGNSGPIVSATDRPSLNAWAVRGVMNDLGVDRVRLVGNSMGGASSLRFALLYPDLIDSMVLMGPGGLLPSIVQPTPPEGIRKLFKLYVEPTYENFEAMLDAFVYDPAAITDDLRRNRFAAIQDKPEHLKNFVESFKLRPFHADYFDADLPRIPTRTLVTWGRDDRCVPLDHGLRMVSLMPDADLHVFQRCGHWAQWEHADKFNRLAISFFQAS